jgi:hypothetical protein
MVKKQVLTQSQLTESTNSSNSNSNELDPVLSDILKKRDEFFQNILVNL